MTGNAPIRIFYILLLTQTFSLIGSRMTGIAVGIKVFNDTGAVMPLALAGVSYALPLILAAGVAGVAADRWDRRWVLILADAGQAAGTLLLLFSFASGAFQLWHLYTVISLQALFAIFQHPAFQASVTMLIPDSQRDRANAIQQLTNPAAGVMAPILAGALYGLIGVTGVVMIDLLTFAVAILTVLLIRIPRPEPTAEGNMVRASVWREATAGFWILWSRRPLFYLIICITFVNFLWNVFSVALTPYILRRTGSEATLGTLLSIGSMGLVVSALLMSIWRINRPRVHVILPAIIAIGLAMLPFGIVRTPILLALALFLLNLPHPVVNTLLTSLLQLKTPPDAQGRVFATVAQLVLLAAPAGLLLGGFLSDQILEPAVGQPIWTLVEPLVGGQPGAGMGLLMVITGVVYTLSGLLFYSLPGVRDLERELPDYVPTMDFNS